MLDTSNISASNHNMTPFQCLTQLMLFCHQDHHHDSRWSNKLPFEVLAKWEQHVFFKVFAAHGATKIASLGRPISTSPTIISKLWAILNLDHSPRRPCKRLKYNNTESKFTLKALRPLNAGGMGLWRQCEVALLYCLQVPTTTQGKGM